MNESHPLCADQLAGNEAHLRLVLNHRRSFAIQWASGMLAYLVSSLSLFEGRATSSDDTPPLFPASVPIHTSHVRAPQKTGVPLLPRPQSC